MTGFCDICLIKNICLPEVKGWVEHRLAYLAACEPLNIQELKKEAE